MPTYDGVIGTYTFDGKGEVVGLSNTVVEVLLVAERTREREGRWGGGGEAA